MTCSVVSTHNLRLVHIAKLRGVGTILLWFPWAECKILVKAKPCTPGLVPGGLTVVTIHSVHTGDTGKSEWELSNTIGLKGLCLDHTVNFPWLSNNPHLLPQRPSPKTSSANPHCFPFRSRFYPLGHGWSNTGAPRHSLVRTRGGLPSHQAGLLWLWLLAAAAILPGTPVGGVEKNPGYVLYILK